MAKNKKRHKRTVKTRWQKFQYKHTTLLVVTVALFILLLDTAIMTSLLSSIEGLGTFGMFIAGALYVSVFTAAASVVILYEMAQIFNPWVVIAIAACGTVLGDFIIMTAFENKFAGELTRILKKLKLDKVLGVLHRKRLRPLFLTIGLAIIGSPIPDEVGITLMDLTHYSRAKILAMAFIANGFGIAAIVGVGVAVN